MLWRLDRRLIKFIYNILHTNNSTVQSIVNIKLLSENYTYLMSKYKLSNIDCNLSLIYVLTKIKYHHCLNMNHLYTTLRKLCQLRDNLYAYDIYIYG